MEDKHEALRSPPPLPGPRVLGHDKPSDLSPVGPRSLGPLRPGLRRPWATHWNRPLRGKRIFIAGESGMCWREGAGSAWAESDRWLPGPMELREREGGSVGDAENPSLGQPQAACSPSCHLAFPEAFHHLPTKTRGAGDPTRRNASPRFHVGTLQLVNVCPMPFGLTWFPQERRTRTRVWGQLTCHGA